MTVFCGAFGPCYCQEILTGHLCPSLLDPLVWPLLPCLTWPSYQLLDSLPQEVCDSHHLSLEYVGRFLLDWGKSSQKIELTWHSLSTAISCWKHLFSSVDSCSQLHGDAAGSSWLSSLGNGHTTLNTPVLVRSLKLSNVGPG